MTKPSKGGWGNVPPARRRAIGRALRLVDERCDRTERIGADPIGAVRRYRTVRDLELAGLAGACLAFGNVKALRAKVDDAFERLGPALTQVTDDELEVFGRLGGWRHRVYVGEDLGRLLIGARRVQRAHKTLGARFHADLRAGGTLRHGLSRFVEAIRQAGGLDVAARERRGAAHILPDPAKTSGCKRLLLYLRWMIRPDDGVDLGLWSSVSPSVLLVPVDTHIFKLARNLGFTDRRTMTWPVAEEITAALREFDAEDPARFDFPLCHLGMLQRCPSRRDPVRCEGCGVIEVCRHWERAPKKRGAQQKQDAQPRSAKARSATARSAEKGARSSKRRAAVRPTRSR